MSNEMCLVGYPFTRPKHFIEKNGFKVFKQFDTEKNMKNAAMVMTITHIYSTRNAFSNGE